MTRVTLRKQVAVATVMLGLSGGGAAAQELGGQTHSDTLNQEVREVEATRISDAGAREFGELARTRSADPAVKAFADETIDARAELDTALAKLAIPQPSDPVVATDAKHRRFRAKLEGLSGGAFDTAYLHSVIREDRRLLSLLRAESRAGYSGELRELGQAHIAGVEQHAAKARAMLAQMQAKS